MKTSIPKQKIKLYFLYSILLLCIVKPAELWSKTPQQPDSLTSTIELDNYLNKLTTKGKTPGLSLIVVKNDSVIYSKGYGWADIPKEIPATPETVYHWFSVTKIITAVSILQLHEQGKLNIEDSVTKYLPYFDVIYPSDTSNTITIRNLLNHSAGLPGAGVKVVNWIHHEGEPHWNQTEFLKTVLPDYSTLWFEPGEKTSYTNIAYMVLGGIIEMVTNQSYEDYVRQNILDPLGMKHTDFVYTKEMEPFEAGGSHPIINKYTPLIPFMVRSFIRETKGKYIWIKRVYNNQTPPSGLIGSASDAARFVRAYLNNGILDGKRILSEESISMMTNEYHIKSWENAYQGIGWQIYEKDHGNILHHGGGGVGFNFAMQLHPHKNLGFILFSNSTLNSCSEIIELITTYNW